MRRVLVSLFPQARCELLDDADPYVGAQIPNCTNRDENILKSLCGFLIICVGKSLIGEGGHGNVIFDDDIEGVGFVVPDTDADDDGIFAEMVDFDEVFERGLGVCVAEGVVGGGYGVPFRGKGFGVFGLRGCF